MPRGRPQNLIGQKFGRLTVTKLAERDTRRGRWWTCKCECGNVIDVRGDNLHSTRTRSCGCYKKDLREGKVKGARLGRKPACGEGTDEAKARREHKPEYSVWRRIIASCYRKTHPAYGRIGGAGIVVCDKWRNSFKSFFDDVGERPQAGHVLLRKDTAGNFTPDNVAWYPMSESHRRSRSRETK